MHICDSGGDQLGDASAVMRRGSMVIGSFEHLLDFHASDNLGRPLRQRRDVDLSRKVCKHFGRAAAVAMGVAPTMKAAAATGKKRGRPSTKEIQTTRSGQKPAAQTCQVCVAREVGEPQVNGKPPKAEWGFLVGMTVCTRCFAWRNRLGCRPLPLAVVDLLEGGGSGGGGGGDTATDLASWSEGKTTPGTTAAMAATTTPTACNVAAIEAAAQSVVTALATAAAAAAAQVIDLYNAAAAAAQVIDLYNAAEVERRRKENAAAYMARNGGGANTVWDSSFTFVQPPKRRRRTPIAEMTSSVAWNDGGRVPVWWPTPPPPLRPRQQCATFTRSYRMERDGRRAAAGKQVFVRQQNKKGTERTD